MKNVLITGGSRGIGAACVRKFAGNGWNTAFVYNRSEAAAQAISDETGAAAIQADCSDMSAAAGAVLQAAKLLGTLDALVLSAGVAHIAQICDTTDEDFCRICNTDLSGVYAAVREASKIMVRAHSGRIVCIGSVWGKRGASCESAYSAAKAGLRGLTMSLAKELGPSGVLVNCIEPGVIDTDMNSCLDAESRRILCDDIPLERFGSAGDVAELVSFLCSDAASYITGQCIGVDGGFSI